MANRKENQPTKEKKGFTRRQFLKGALALGASALVGPGCQPDQTPSSQPEKTPLDQPTQTPTREASPTTQSPTVAKEPTAIPTPEATPTPEAKLFEGIDIDREYLQNAFTGIGGGEELDMMAFGQDYVIQSWGEEIDFASLSEDSIASLKYLVSLGAYQGQLGFFYPGKEGEVIAFPGLVEDKEGQEKPLTLLRLELENLPQKKETAEEDYSEWVFPQGLKLNKNTQMTVLGYTERDKEGSELVYALTAFTDYLRASEESGVPRHYLAILPTHFPADPDNKQALTLANLLGANGYDYDPQQRAVSFTDPDTDKKTAWQLNKLVGQDLSYDLYRAAGLAFVDQLDGEQINNPILPYPQGVQDKYQLEKEGNQFIFTGQNEEGEEITLRGSYDQEKEKWGWEIFISPEVTAEKVLTIAGLDKEWNSREGRWEYLDPNDGLLAGYWNVEEERFELLADEVRGEWAGLWVEADEVVVAGVADSLRRGVPAWLVNFDIVSGGGRIREALQKLTKNKAKELLIYHLSPGIEFKTPFAAQMNDFGGTFWGEPTKGVLIKPDYDSLGVSFDHIHPDDYVYSGFSVSEGTVFCRSSLNFIDSRIGLSIGDRDSGADFSSEFLRNIQLIVETGETSDDFDGSLSLSDLARNPQGLFYYLR